VRRHLDRAAAVHIRDRHTFVVAAAAEEKLDYFTATLRGYLWTEPIEEMLGFQGSLTSSLPPASRGGTSSRSIAPTSPGRKSPSPTQPSGHAARARRLGIAGAASSTILTAGARRSERIAYGLAKHPTESACSHGSGCVTESEVVACRGLMAMGSWRSCTLPAGFHR
jgi:hypothetical protein